MNFWPENLGKIKKTETKRIQQQVALTLLIQHALRTPDTVDFVPKLVRQNITSAIHASRPSRNVSRNRAPKQAAQPLPQASVAGEGAVQHEEVLEDVGEAPAAGLEGPEGADLARGAEGFLDSLEEHRTPSSPGTPRG